jgi:hypothetical protein
MRNAMTPFMPNRTGQNTVVDARDLAKAAQADQRSQHGGSRPKQSAGSRVLRRIAAGIVLLFIAGGLPACSAISTDNFSGGGVPIGGSRLFGRVVSAANTSTNLSNVTVDVRATPEGGVEHDIRMKTGNDGMFDFTNVLPGVPVGNVQITATPADTAYQPATLSFNVANGHTEQLILTLPPASFDPASAQSVAIAIASPAVPTGSSVQVQAVVRDAAGMPLPVSPTLVFDGDFGMLGPDDTFTVPANVQAGTGTITAFWYNLLPQSQPIHVDSTASPQPPQPPILPKSQAPKG